jgi:hypothetical protein
MGLFSGIMSKIFGHAPAAKAQPAPVAPTIQPVVSAPPTPAAEAPPNASPVAPPPPVVDVTAVLDDLAAHNGEKLDWRKSIVDLMKLVGMDSSLASRKELADDLGYTGDKGDSAKMNVWLHREVIKQLAANGGKVPADLLD